MGSGAAPGSPPAERASGTAADAGARRDFSPDVVVASGYARRVVAGRGVDVVCQLDRLGAATKASRPLVGPADLRGSSGAGWAESPGLVPPAGGGGPGPDHDATVTTWPRSRRWSTRVWRRGAEGTS